MLAIVTDAVVILFLFGVIASYLLSGIRSRSLAVGFESLRKINECAAKYSSNHPLEGYPSSLALMGTTGGKCIDARPTDFGCTSIDVGRSGFWSFFSDETGTIHYRKQNRPDTASDHELGTEERQL